MSLVLHNGGSSSSSDVLISKKGQRSGMYWSLRPLAIFIKVLTGVRIHLNNRSNFCVKWILLTYSLLMILSNMSVQYISYRWESFTSGTEMKIRPGVSRQPREGDQTNGDRKIVEMISSAQIILVHLTFFILQFSRHWEELWKIIKEVEECIDLDSNFYKWCRKMVTIGCMFPFLEFANSFWGLYYSIMADIGGFFYNQVFMGFFLVMNNMAVLASICIPILVFAMIFIVGAIFGVLNREVSELREEYFASMDSKRLLIALNEWKRKHLVAAKLVDKINTCFGIIILLVVLRGFVFIIVNSYNMVTSGVSKRKEGAGLDVTIFPWVGIILEVFYLVLAISSAYYLQNRISSMTKNLFQLNSLLNPQLQDMVYSALLQVIDETPLITAAGFFEVNLILFPTLVGTTVTYIMLIYDRASLAGRSIDDDALKNCSAVAASGR